MIYTNIELKINKGRVYVLDEGKEYTLKIENLGYEGEGIAKIDRYPIFIKDTLIGETVKVKITKAKKNYAYGKLIEIIDKSRERITPKCDYYNKCGGCTLMHCTYKEQLEFKFNRVKDCIKKIAGLNDEIVKFPLGMKHEFGYRNKVQLPVSLINGKPAIGFYSQSTHEVIDIEKCLLQDEQANKVINIVKVWMNMYKIVPANKDGKFFENGLLRHIIIKRAFKTEEIMIILVTTNKKIPKADELIKELREKVKGIKSVVQNINSKNTNVIMGEKSITIWGETYISDYIGKYKFSISPLSFFQVNSVQAEILYTKALEYANLTGNEIVFDAYCGTGTISLFLSQKAKKVYGVEIIEDAIRNARDNAIKNNISNAEFFVGKSEEVIPNLIDTGIKPDVIVVDPPRKGCDVKLLDAIGRGKPNRIVYVSCDPSTLARDIKYLNQLGYKSIEVQPVDMFPMTPHVETVVGLRRKDL